MVAVTHAPGLCLLHFMTVDPTPQLVSQPVRQGYTHQTLAHKTHKELEGTKVRWLNKLITDSMHLVLLIGGWQASGCLKKTGSFTTIRALSSELKQRREHTERKIRKQIRVLQGCSHTPKCLKGIQKALFKNTFHMLGICSECKPEARKAACPLI